MLKRYLMLAGIVCYVLGVFAINVLPAPKVSAATGNNLLYDIGSRCSNFKKTTEQKPAGRGVVTVGTGLWGDCTGWQDTQNSQLGCSDSMFYQPKDPNDASAKLDVYYTDSAKFAACYAKANSKISILASDKCKSMRHGDGVDDSDAWKECEKEQNRLHDALGCSDRMFKPSGTKGYYTQDQGAIDNCKGRVAAIGGLKIMTPAGENPKTVKELSEGNGNTGEAGEGEEKAQADCDTKATSPLSWIICPIVDLGANLTDFVFKDIVSPLLKDVPIRAEKGDKGYVAWQQFRLIGNVLLVGSLLAIVYSQAKGPK